MASAKRNSGARSRYGSRIRSGNKKLFSLSIKQLTVFASLYHISHTSRSGTLSRTHSRQRQLPLFCRFWRTELQKKKLQSNACDKEFLGPYPNRGNTAVPEHNHSYFPLDSWPDCSRSISALRLPIKEKGLPPLCVFSNWVIHRI